MNATILAAELAIAKLNLAHCEQRVRQLLAFSKRGGNVPEETFQDRELAYRICEQEVIIAQAKLDIVGGSPVKDSE